MFAGFLVILASLKFLVLFDWKLGKEVVSETLDHRSQQHHGHLAGLSPRTTFFDQ